MKKFRFLLRYMGTANWYQGIDKPTFLQWLYQWRIGYGTANKLWELTKHSHYENTTPDA